MPPAIRWTKDCEAAKFLKAALENGDLDPSTQPKAAWESNPLFKQYTLQQFRSGWNKAKAESGSLVRTGGATKMVSSGKLILIMLL